MWRWSKCRVLGYVYFKPWPRPVVNGQRNSCLCVNPRDEWPPGISDPQEWVTPGMSDSRDEWPPGMSDSRNEWLQGWVIPSDKWSPGMSDPQGWVTPKGELPRGMSLIAIVTNNLLGLIYFVCKTKCVNWLQAQFIILINVFNGFIVTSGKK